MFPILEMYTFISYIYFKTIVIDISILFKKWRGSSPVFPWQMPIMSWFKIMVNLIDRSSCWKFMRITIANYRHIYKIKMKLIFILFTFNVNLCEKLFPFFKDSTFFYFIFTVRWHYTIMYSWWTTIYTIKNELIVRNSKHEMI
jgi:hypothetical protein